MLAVIYEAERGSSWTQIAAYLGINADETRQKSDIRLLSKHGCHTGDAPCQPPGSAGSPRMDRTSDA